MCPEAPQLPDWATLRTTECGSHQPGRRGFRILPGGPEAAHGTRRLLVLWKRPPLPTWGPHLALCRGRRWAVLTPLLIVMVSGDQGRLPRKQALGCRASGLWGTRLGRTGGRQAPPLTGTGLCEQEGGSWAGQGQLQAETGLQPLLSPGVDRTWGSHVGGRSWPQHLAAFGRWPGLLRRLGSQLDHGGGPWALTSRTLSDLRLRFLEVSTMACSADTTCPAASPGQAPVDRVWAAQWAWPSSFHCWTSTNHPGFPWPGDCTGAESDGQCRVSTWLGCPDTWSIVFWCACEGFPEETDI